MQLNKTGHNRRVSFFRLQKEFPLLVRNLFFMTVLYAFLFLHMFVVSAETRGATGEQVLQERDRLSTIKKGMHSSCFSINTPHTFSAPLSAMFISSAVENPPAAHAKERLYFFRPESGDELEGGGAAAAVVLMKDLVLQH